MSTLLIGKNNLFAKLNYPPKRKLIMFFALDVDEEYKVNTYSKEHWTPLLELIPSLEKLQGKYWREDEVAFGDMAVKLENLIYGLQIVMADYSLKFEDGWLRRDCFEVGFDLNTLSLVDLCKMLTGIVRGERFCENLIASYITDGILAKLLQAIWLKVNQNQE